MKRHRIVRPVSSRPGPPLPPDPVFTCTGCSNSTFKLCEQRYCWVCCEKKHGGPRYCLVFYSIFVCLEKETILPNDLINLILKFSGLYKKCVKCLVKNIQDPPSSIDRKDQSLIYACAMCRDYMHFQCCRVSYVQTPTYTQQIVCESCIQKHKESMVKTSFESYSLRAKFF
jgi:hypothetical protein